MFTEVTTKKKVQTVAQLAQKIWTEHYIPIIGKEQTEYMLEKFQSADAILREIQKENFLYFLIEPPDRLTAGYLAVQPRKDDLLLSKIYIERSSRGYGIGHQTIRFVEELAQELEKSAITLMVNRHNSGSIASYSRWGFRITNTAKTDIGNGFVMDDYVMQKETQAAK
jgi:ribosomal protein S18 acetylase RimI-like enzyme